MGIVDIIIIVFILVFAFKGTINGFITSPWGPRSPAGPGSPWGPRSPAGPMAPGTPSAPWGPRGPAWT